VIGMACLVVLLAQVVGQGGRLAPGTVAFATFVIGVLLVLDRQVGLQYGYQPPLPIAVGIVLIHGLLVEGLTLLDGLTYTAMMYLTLPFPACFLLGQRAGFGISLAIFGWFTLKYTLFKPDGLIDPAGLNTYLLFVIALALITAMAQVVQQERGSRQRAEALLHDLDRSHQQLAASHAQVLRSTAQVAELAMIAERNRLARDIHDSLGHYLTVIGVQLEKALIVGDDDPAALRAAVGHAKRLTDQALSDVRSSVSALRQDDTPFVLRAALEQLVADLRELPFTISLTINGDEKPYARQQLLALYRAAQEGLTNVQKHAHAENARLVVEFGERMATMILEDDGIGIAADQVERGMGLRGVQERLELVSGRLVVQRGPAGGTRLEVTLLRTGHQEKAA
jgi:signal transduction histidine kinase